MRSVVIGLTLLALGAGAASAQQYVVVESNSPNYKKDDVLQGGARVSAKVGETVTVMNAAGEIWKISGQSIKLPQDESKGKEKPSKQ